VDEALALAGAEDDHVRAVGSDLRNAPGQLSKLGHPRRAVRFGHDDQAVVVALGIDFDAAAS
jgi:hypothetical protein